MSRPRGTGQGGPGRALGVGGEGQQRTAGASDPRMGPIIHVETGCHSSGKGRRKQRWVLITEYWASVMVLTIIFVLTTRQALS